MLKLLGRIGKALDHFAAGRGFAVLTVICVAVITATALWTQRTPPPQDEPLPTMHNLQAVALWQQTLPAVTPTPLPTRQPALWQAPLADVDVIVPFSINTMKQSGVTGVWAVHAAVDLAAKAGTPVAAMASGSVLDCGTGSPDGVWISVTHEDGYVSRYAGLSLLGAFRPGDPVSAGQTVGFVGNGVIAETDLPPHLHLQVIHHGQPIDPMTLLLQTD